METVITNVYIYSHNFGYVVPGLLDIDFLDEYRDTVFKPQAIYDIKLLII